MREESYKTSFKRVGKVLLITILYFGIMMAMPEGAPATPIISGMLTIPYLGYIIYLTCKPKS